MCNGGMGLGKKLAIGALSVLPVIAGIVAIVALSGEGTDSEVLFYLALGVSGFVDTGLAAFYIPHVHDNKRLGDKKIVWIVLLGIPYVTVAPIYWLIYVLPEKPAPPEEEGPVGGAWYADPWGQAPFRWWDGERWTDWVTGPPAGG